jgi:uncharacterized protein YecT (DUF1311 family)
MTGRTAALALLCAALAVPPVAPAGPATQQAACWDHADTQAAMNACAVEEYKAADAELNEAYQKALFKYAKAPSRTAALKKAQRAWLEFRDAHVESMFPAENRRVVASVSRMCIELELAKLTRQRVEQLKSLLQRREGEACAIPGEDQ